MRPNGIVRGGVESASDCSACKASAAQLLRWTPGMAQVGEHAPLLWVERDPAMVPANEWRPDVFQRQVRIACSSVGRCVRRI